MALTQVDDTAVEVANRYSEDMVVKKLGDMQETHDVSINS